MGGVRDRVVLAAALLALPGVARAQACDAGQVALYTACGAVGNSRCSDNCDTAAVVHRLRRCQINGASAADAVRDCCDTAQRAALSADTCFQCGYACPVVETLALLGRCVYQGQVQTDVLRQECDDQADCGVVNDAVFVHSRNQSSTCWGAIGAASARVAPCAYQCEAGYGIPAVTDELATTHARSQVWALANGHGWAGLSEQAKCQAANRRDIPSWVAFPPSGSPPAGARACVSCASGKYSDCSSVGCIECPAGQTPLPGQDGCRPCVRRLVARVWQDSDTPCRPSESLATCQRSVSNGRKCEECAAGSEPNADFSGCQTCTDTQHSNGFGCEECAPGWMPDTNGGFGCIDIPECDTALAHCSRGTTCTEDTGNYTCSPCPGGAAGTPYISDDRRDPRFCDPFGPEICGCADVDECADSYRVPPSVPRWPGRDDGMTACPVNTLCTNVGETGGLEVSLLPGSGFPPKVLWQAGDTGRNPTSLGYNCSCIENTTQVLLGNAEYNFRRGYDSVAWADSGYKTCGDINECENELSPTGWAIDEDTGLREYSDSRLGVDLEPGQDFCQRLQPEGYYCPNGGIPYLQNIDDVPFQGTTQGTDWTVDAGGAGATILWSHEEHGILGLKPSGCSASKPFDQLNSTASGEAALDLLDLGGAALSQGVSYLEDLGHGGGHIISEMATQMNDVTHANQNLLLLAGICINLPGTHACCMDYKKLVHNPYLISGRKQISNWRDQSLPFAKDTYVYPRECQAINFCTGDVERHQAENVRAGQNGTLPLTQPDVARRQVEWDKYIVRAGVGEPGTGGCDPESQCSPTVVAEAGDAHRDGSYVIAIGRTNWDSMEAWYGVKCSPCPSTGKGGEDLEVKWGPQISQAKHGSIGLAGTEPKLECQEGPDGTSPMDCDQEPLWNRFCTDQSGAQQNTSTITTAVVCFILVCCCGLIKTNRSMQVELEEARRNELQKLVLENFENHPRKAGYVGDTGVDDEIMPTLDLDADTLTNPVALGDYGWRMARFQVGNIGRLGRDGLAVLTNVVGTVVDATVDVTDAAIQYVPGQQVRDLMLSK